MSKLLRLAQDQNEQVFIAALDGFTLQMRVRRPWFPKGREQKWDCFNVIPRDKPFRFLELPYELRLKIYELALTFDNPIRPRITWPSTREVLRHTRDFTDPLVPRTRKFHNKLPYAQNVHNFETDNYRVDYCSRSQRSCNVDITLTCHKLHNEALPVFYATNVFDFGGNYGAMEHFLESMQAKGRLGMLRRVRAWIPTDMEDDKESEWTTADFSLMRSLALLVRARVGKRVCYGDIHPVLTLTSPWDIDHPDRRTGLDRWSHALEDHGITISWQSRPDFEWDNVPTQPRMTPIEWRWADQTSEGGIGCKRNSQLEPEKRGYFCNCNPQCPWVEASQRDSSRSDTLQHYYEANAEIAAMPKEQWNHDNTALIVSSVPTSPKGMTKADFYARFVQPYLISPVMRDYRTDTDFSFWNPDPRMEIPEIWKDVKSVKSQQCTGPQLTIDEPPCLCRNCYAAPINFNNPQDLASLSRVGTMALGKMCSPNGPRLAVPNTPPSTVDDLFLLRWSRDMRARVRDMYMQWDSEQDLNDRDDITASG
ncbi:hypothetical protein K432DRAFT_1183 [Lepidopterella palustris CBS 459.81]|uniref:F-box domain-containing protein n=1 Tax=Lepidopterella palustris CBS 459.81 TaxID=1314670 RepID=A0A8E2JKV4_9PEZI|nr:hypothetical protein K432DRAFT_1183 [Lepidopterella palustris CBS 459.81]